MEPPSKRARIDGTDDTCDSPRPGSLSRPISPPRRKKRNQMPQTIASPWQLTWIQDYPEEKNRDAVTLKDILGDPLIAECWEFNYLHDINFLMDAFDPDVRHLVKVHVIHGFWKREDPTREVLQQDAAQYPNVQLHAAPMPEMFGTHHSKMMILLRHDGAAQVVIHTANMIPKDWTNMTNAVWKSPLLPKMQPDTTRTFGSQEDPLGSGERFKCDLLSYLRAYDSRRILCKPLVDELQKYDFSSIRAVLIASVPGRHDIHDLSQTPWGWSALRRHLKSVPCVDDDSELVVQISSVATLGPKDEWLQKTLFDSLSRSNTSDSKRPRFKVVFPTAEEIRRSLDGYMSGGSIHWKIKSAQQIKQLQYMRPMLHHWTNDPSANGRDDYGNEPAAGVVIPRSTHNRQSIKSIEGAGCRERAAPHIKTYVRYNSTGAIDWAMLTSANLSKQAWGEATSSSSTTRISSWEIGVLVWPELVSQGSRMVPTLLADAPDPEFWSAGGESTSLVGVRVPYGLPLTPYQNDTEPWVADKGHREADWMGVRWMNEIEE